MVEKSLLAPTKADRLVDRLGRDNTMLAAPHQQRQSLLHETDNIPYTST